MKFYSQIMTQLKQKFPGVSKAALELIAKRLAKKVTEDTGIEDAITAFDDAVGVQDFAGALQVEGDRRVTEATKRKQQEDQDDEDEDEPTPEAKPKPKGKKAKGEDEVPSWAKGLLAEIASIKTEKKKESVHDAVKKLMGDKIPASFLKGRHLDPEKEPADLFAEIEADYQELQTELTGKGLGEMVHIPAGGTGKASAATDKAVLATIEQWGKKSQPAVVTDSKK